MTEREVIRWGACKLNQFITQSGNCRRCRMVLKPKPVEEPFVAVLLSKAEVEKPPALTAGAFGLTIRLIRLAMGLSQRDLAKRLGIPRSGISKVERYPHPPSIPHLQRIAAALETTPFVLVTLASA